MPQSHNTIPNFSKCLGIRFNSRDKTFRISGYERRSGLREKQMLYGDVLFHCELPIAARALDFV
jgi:hypothetical protein